MASLELGHKLNEYLAPTIRKRTTLNHLHQFIHGRRKNLLYLPMCKILTQAAVDVADANKDRHCLIFTRNPTTVLRTTYNDGHKPDIIAFLGTRKEAKNVISGRLMPSPPSTYDILSGAELKTSGNSGDQAFHYAQLFARHRPTSSVQYVLVVTKEKFYLYTLELDRDIRSEEVSWVDGQESWNGKASGPVSKALRKLWQCVKMIRDEVSLPNQSPKLSMVLKNGASTIALYTVQAGGIEYRLLPIYRGKGIGRKPFVALGVDLSNPWRTCVFKYSWRLISRRTKESDILRTIHNDGFAPGVVRLNTELTQDTLLQNDGMKALREQRLLVLDTIGHPLCSCTTALEFLEAMYDLLEVLRFLVAEKKILYRDVSWGNVLIKPRHVSGEKDKEPEPDVRPKASRDAGSPHNYRFISDIYGEHKLNVRVALTDFDNAVDLESEEATSELSYTTGTPIFMANDVIFPSGSSDMQGPSETSLCRIEELVDDEVGRRKYGERSPDEMDISDEAQPDEKDVWDKFYKVEMKNISFIAKSEPKASFKQAAVHDAESVFYLCMLFFLRMRPVLDDVEDEEKTRKRSRVFKRLVEKQVGDSYSRAFPEELDLVDFSPLFSSALEDIRMYLSTPWYNVRGTGRGERYEFHAHDFMQRLILKTILAMQDKDHVALHTEPIRIYLDEALRNGFSSSSANVMKLIDGITSSKVNALSTTLTPSQKSQNQESNGDEPNIPECRVPKGEFAAQRAAFPELFWTILLWKKRERLWLMADKI